MKKAITALFMLVVLAGCETTQPTYYYGDYTKAVYSFFKSDDLTVEQQIMSLEQAIETAAAKNKPVAPGLHAHLGMLYFETGNESQGLQHFEQEKASFPESSKYIDFLISSRTEA